MTPPTDDVLAACQLAGLAALDAAVVLAARALVNTYPAIANVERPNEPPELATARHLVDQCESLLAALDLHQCHVARRVPTRPPRDDMPF